MLIFTAGNKRLRWHGTISYMVGMTLTAFNIYPLNLYPLLIGAILWSAAAYDSNDPPLLLVELAAVLINVCGIGFSLIQVMK
jgi:hypothetical protein